MEIRQVLRGGTTGFAPTRPAKEEKTSAAGTPRPSTDRVEWSRQWVEAMEEQRAQAQSALLSGEKKSDGILDMLDGPGSEEADAMTEAMKAKMKCLEIAMRIMQGKRVPPQDEQYLMENDPEGYKLAMAARSMVKVEDEECESVLEDEDQSSSASAETGETAEAGGSGEVSGSAPAESSGETSSSEE